MFSVNVLVHLIFKFTGVAFFIPAFALDYNFFQEKWFLLRRKGVD